MGRRNNPKGRSPRRDTQSSRRYDDYDYDRRDRDRGGRDYRNDRDRDRDRDRRREDDRRDYDSRRSRSERDDRRDRERDRGEGRYHRSSRDEPKRGKPVDEKHSRRGGRRERRRRNAPPPAPRNFFCHLCVGNHWTTDCPRLRQHPEEYPLMSVTKGCCQCGQRGHKVADCTRRKYHCRECGGIHDRKDCVYTHKAEEWHEFMDPLSQHVFYVNYADPKEVQWNPPSHKLDVILWYCPTCQVMVPNEFDECLKCHAPRPVSVENDITSSDSESSSYSDESDGSDSDSGDSRGSNH